MYYNVVQFLITQNYVLGTTLAPEGWAISCWSEQGGCYKKGNRWGAWVAQSVKCPTLAQVMIPWFGSWVQDPRQALC